MHDDLNFTSRRRIKSIKQVELAECGLACLAMLANYFGLEIDLGTLRRRFSPSLRGASLRSLMAIADKLGFETRALRIELEDINALELPAILHWDGNHFVVLEKATSRRGLIHNPTGKSGWLPMSQISEHFTGIALELQPAPQFHWGRQRWR